MKFRIDRRTFVALGGTVLAAPHALLAQPSKRVYRIAILDDAVESARAESWKLFRNRLRELGLVEGKDVVYEARYAGGANERQPALAAELVALKPDVIVCAGTPSAVAAIKATSTIPILFVGVSDPVGSGLVASLARPGGNATGTSIRTGELARKWLELLRELTPSIKRIGFLTVASNKASVASFRQAEEQARTVNVAIRMLDCAQQSDLERSFETIKREKLQGLIVGATAVLLEHRDQIVQFAARSSLPVVYPRREYVAAGGLLSYGLDNQFGYLRNAEYAHRILQGTRPADLPVEQSSKVQMALNLKTARALGIAIPASIRLRSDEVIE